MDEMPGNGDTVSDSRRSAQRPAAPVPHSPGPGAPVPEPGLHGPGPGQYVPGGQPPDEHTMSFRIPRRHQGPESWDEPGWWRDEPDHVPISSAPPRRSRRRLAVAGGAGAVVAGALAGVLIVTNVFGLAKPAPTPGFHPTATQPAGEARQTAAAFLSAWAKGDLRKAAGYTNHPNSAAVALTSYRDGLHLHGLHLSVRSAAPSGKVTFAVAATVGLPATPAPAASARAGAGQSAGNAQPSATGQQAQGGQAGDAAVTATWSYTSALTAYPRDGAWWVRWDPVLVAPNLTAGEKVISVRVAPGADEVADAAGSNLADSGDPGLQHIAAALMSSAPAGLGTPGIEVELARADGTPLTATADLIRHPVATGVVTTTIQPQAEAAAQAAVQAHPDSAMVILQPSTGHILAVANNDGANDFALTARVAPGSTNKIITSTALLTSGLVSSPSQAVGCPAQLVINGLTLKNDQGESEPDSTPFLTDFAASCNNAFSRWYTQIGAGTLAQTAQKYFGLNEVWNIGVGPGGPYYALPSTAYTGELAEELVGQGKVVASPLAMASVAATVDTGSFRQPIVVAGQPQLTATPLPAGAAADLRQMMQAVTQPGGTAAGVFTGVSSPVYGKTGTAQVGGQQQPNSWMVVFDPTLDVAIGCVVLNAGYGASFAAPETATALQQLSGT